MHIPIHIQWTLTSFDFVTPLFYTLQVLDSYVHHHSSVPGKSQDDVRLDPALPFTILPPVILVLLPQFLRIQHMSTDTQLASAYDPLNLDGFVSLCHPHTVTQICH